MVIKQLKPDQDWEEKKSTYKSFSLGQSKVSNLEYTLDL